MSESPAKPAPFGAVSAPGKSFLIGEYAVLEGHTAVVTAVDVRAHAHSPRPQHDERPSPDSPFVAAAVELVSGWLRGHDYEVPAPEALPVITTVGFTAGNRKLGLGSSAAVTAATVGWYLASAGLDVSSPEIREIALSIARAAHSMAQEGRGSGADVATAVLGGTVRFSREGIEPITTPSWLAIGFFDAGAPARTGSLLESLEAGAAGSREAYDAAIAGIGAASQRFQAALDPALAMDDAFAAIQDACRRHNEGLRQLQDIASAHILTARIETIIGAAEWAGLAAKPSGAGGGDLVVVFARSGAALDRLAVELYHQHRVALVRKLETNAEGLRAEPRPPVNSRIKGLFKRSIDARREALALATGVPLARLADADAGALAPEAADHMIENVIGVMSMPMGIGTNFTLNGRDYLVPMCVEEASVVAAASNAAKMIRAGGGFAGFSDPPWMIAQVQLVRDDRSPSAEIVARIEGARDRLLELADEAHPRLVERGGGARDIEVRNLDVDNIVVHVLVDCRDAMGANLLNTVAETLAPELAQISGWRPVLRILSNLADRRASHVSVRVPAHMLASKQLDGGDVAQRIEEASRFAELDPYRATTHNKGIMNGVDAVVIATGNDWRAMEASAHAYAVRGGRYGPLATWRVERDADDAIAALRGKLSIPTAVGVVGGATRSHPTARMALEILGNPSGVELGLIMAAAGLASNLAALRALATEGIQRGHMTLHARAVAMAAGARGAEVEALARRLVDVGEIKPERAQALLGELREGGR
ncbi:hydroxymethylglutaryl-CoA reductase, degradative [Pseudenhygromyxa sp. WMMC2535]|uniref:hydroxymethylglutaryl-CoA reductase, degradative n=1 Tax=Pseudenhygromyxa sp. WMMC2535 TaxID=2712867 RepID=UPI0015544EF2|nr:hydroxymethylglutaryl-CoA reductase, degradative [Pseudenhygromyxa sp. WMMC2535]NVB41713.1 hydroxymethylglutaryl-CoA reductase, degradative [Pseudenhygromyxa sp. WMMC2535]